MKNFRLLSRTRQSTDYTCGPSALQAVLSYWGRDVEERDLATLLRTTSEVGTFPEDIARGAWILGFDAEVRENLTLDDVQAFTAKGDPMIALAQVWRSQRDALKPVTEDWDNGHYIVVLGVDNDNVYFQDPFVRMSKAFVPRKTFEDHWHQAMGGDTKNQPKLMHVGIFVRGEKPRPTVAPATQELASLDFQKVGSLNLMVLKFGGVLLPFDFMTELKQIWQDGSVRPNAFIFLRKDKHGALSGMEGSHLEEDDAISAANAVIAALAARGLDSPEATRSKVEAAINATAELDFGLSVSDIQKLGERIGPEESAMIVLFENVWEQKLKEIAGKHGGSVAGQRLIAPEALARAARQLAFEATGV